MLQVVWEATPANPGSALIRLAIMTSMNLRQLTYFLAIVDHGGVHRAAEALHIAQSSLSQTMRALERDLEIELFHRIGRGLVLTPAGEALVGSARSILREVDSAERAVRDIAGLRGGTIDIATLADLAVDPVSTWIGVLTPPMSQRSHGAKAGSRPIAVCSMACAAAPISRGAQPRERCSDCGTLHQTASVIMRCAGMSISVESSTSCVTSSRRM